MTDRPDKTITDMFTDWGKQMKLPQIDFEALTTAHRKNIEAISKSAAALSEGGRSIAAKQQEIAANVMRETQALIADFKPQGSPQDILAKQAELSRRVFEAAVANMRDIAELIQKSGTAASAIIMERMKESVAEARAAIERK